MGKTEERSLLIPGVIIGVVALVGYGFYAQGQRGPTSAATANAQSPDEKRLADVLAADSMSRAAIEAGFGDSKDSLDRGAVLFARWAEKRMSWASVSKSETSFAQAEKDVDGSRRKVACASGSIVEIQRDEGLFVGGLTTSEGVVVRFIAVGDTAELVKGSTASFCGIVVGRINYANTLGGRTNGIQSVGMFDLPKNH